MAAYKFINFLLLKLRVPASVPNALHSLPQPQHAPLRHTKSALASLHDLDDSEDAENARLVSEIRQSQSSLFLAGLAGSSDEGSPTSSPRSKVGLALDGAESPRNMSPGTHTPSEAIIRFLGHIQRLGETLKTHHKADLQRLMVERTLAPGEQLYRNGEDARDGLYLIVSGRFGVLAEHKQQTVCLCEFEAGTSLGENALIAGCVPNVVQGGGRGGAFAMASSSGSGSGSGSLLHKPLQQQAFWMPSSWATRPSSCTALEESRVLCLSAAAFAGFAGRFPEAVTTIILENTCRQWRVAHTLLVDYFLLEEAWRASLEPPGSSPAFSFSAGEGGLWGVPAGGAGSGSSSSSSSGSGSGSGIGGGGSWGLGGSEAALSSLAPPVCLPCADLEAAASEVKLFRPGEVVYAEGQSCGELYCILDGWCATTHGEPSRGSREWHTIPHHPDFPLASLPRHFPPQPATTRAGVAGAVYSQQAQALAQQPPLLRLLGRGCISAGPACLNALTHRESLIAVGDKPLRVAVFKRHVFTQLAKMESTWGGGLLPFSSPRSDTEAGSEASPRTPAGTPEPQHSPNAAAPAQGGTTHAKHPGHHLAKPAVVLLVALAVARSMVALPRMLLSLGIRRTWKACGEKIFTEGEPSNGMYFIVSGRVRCENKPAVRPESMPRYHRDHSHHHNSSNHPSPAPTASATASPLFMDVCAGGTVGELSVLSKEQERSSTAVAARDCELVHISAPSFAILVSRHVSVFEHFTASLARRVADTTSALLSGRGVGGSGAPGFLGVEKAVGIPFSLSAPPPPTLSFGGSTHGLGRKMRRLGVGMGGGGATRAPFSAPAAPAHAASGGAGGAAASSSSSAAPSGTFFHPPPAIPSSPTTTTSGSNSPTTTLHAAPTASRFLPLPPPTSTPTAWAACHPSLVTTHPCAPSFSTLTLLPAGGQKLPQGAILTLARELAQALAVTEGGPAVVARRGDMEASLGEGSSGKLNFQYGRSRASAWLGSLEEQSVFTVLVVEGEGEGEGRGGGGLLVDDMWAKLCVQHSDVVLLVGMGGTSPTLSKLEERLLLHSSVEQHSLARIDLCLLQPMGTPPTATREWFEGSAAGAGGEEAPGGVSGSSSSRAGVMRSSGGGSMVGLGRSTSSAPGSLPVSAPLGRCSWRRQITQHHHIRVQSRTDLRLSASGVGDVARLSRLLTGKAVGVILGGGGSRGLAHLGLIRELVSRGIPIDVIGGASQGSFMAAAWALTESLGAMEQRVGQLAAGVGSTLNILTALTLPLVSWTSGAHFDDLVRSALGSGMIEDMCGPRFFAVSLNATDGALAVHAAGPLWRYVRASMGVLKLLPPVFDRETRRLLVDGGYVANLPVDVLHALLPGAVGLTFACDVENKESTANWLDIDESDYGRGDSVELSGWWVAARWLLSSLGLGKPIRIPWTDELFLQVSYMMHYSSLRTLLSEEGYDGAMKEPLSEEGEEGEEGEGGGASYAPRGGSGGGGGGAGQMPGRPVLCYIRPKVGKYSLLQYDLMPEIVEVGVRASKAALDKWERRWRRPTGAPL